MRQISQRRDDKGAGSQRVPAAIARTRGLLGVLRRSLAWRKDRQRLLEMDDHLLDDIGLTRQQVRRMDFGGRGSSR